MAINSERMKEFTLPYDWKELVEKVQRGDCVLLLGADSPYGFDRKIAPPCTSEIAEVLMSRFDYDRRSYLLQDVAQIYESRFGSHGLIEQIRILSEGRPRYRPRAVDELIANLPFSAIITTRYDTLLEEALSNAGKTPEVIVSSADVPYLATDKTLVLKLHGCITRPDSLVITRRHSLNLQRRLEAVLNLVRYLFVTKHLLFIDYNLEDFEFQYLLNEVIHTVGIHHRRAFSIWSKYPSSFVTTWKDISVAVLEADSVDFLHELQKNFQFQTPPKLTIEKPKTPLTKPPYKFLDFFDKSDSDIFYGRDLEILYCWRRILSHSLVTIFGPSGAGKTSLFLAGISTELEKENYQVIIIRALSEPLNAIKETLEKNLPGIDVGQSLMAIFKNIFRDNEKKIVIALDQFEEVFLSAGEQVRRQLYKEISEVLSDNTLNVRFVFILREDFLALLDEARISIPNIFTNSYRVTHLSREQAQLAIIEPALRAGIMFESVLLDRLLSDLDEEGIAPPQLQIICYQFYLKCLHRAKEHGKEGVKGEIVTLEQYETMGGGAKILADYLEQVLREIEEANGIAAKAAAVEVLKIMVSSQHTKLALALKDIEMRGQARRMPLEIAERAIKTLVNKRLVRRFERHGSPYFELAHDYLSHHVAQWISEEEWAAKRVREIVTREMGNWQEAHSLMSLERFQLINNLRDDLLNLQITEAALLVKCAFKYGIDCKHWLKMAVSAGLEIWEILEQILQNSDPFIRSRAIEYIKEQERAKAIIKLQKLTTDKHVRIRELVVEQLEILNASEVLPELIKLLEDDYPSVCWRAAKALYTIGTYDAISALENYSPRNMIFIPSGEYWIGSTHEEILKLIQAGAEGYCQNESPQHKVNVDAFLIDRFLVTNIEYAKFVEATNYPTPTYWINGKVPPQKEHHPVQLVTWHDANAYAQWAGKRLPTEYEWEIAVSWDPINKVKLRYPWGNKFERSLCNVYSRGETNPVGYYSPKGDSPYGLADAVGNLWVWVDGYYEAYPGNTYSDPNYGKGYRINRGSGCWDMTWLYSHTSNRSSCIDIASEEVGFRCAMSIPKWVTKHDKK